MKRSLKFVAAMVLLAGACPALAEVVQYEVTFESSFSADNHPVEFPDNGHFTTHIGATHNADYSYWSPGGISREGIKVLAEMGTSGPSEEEVAAAMEAGTANQFIRMPAEGSRSFRISSRFPLISMASMIAPSPDWFIGFHGVDLRAGGDWIEEISFDAWAYDAGTDSGPTYRSPNEVTEPFEPIARITDGIFDGAPRLGEFTIRRTGLLGDVNGSGVVDVRDVAAICSGLGSADDRYEFTDDDTITVADAHAFVEQRLGTIPGDANLDGDVNFDDFLLLSANFGRDFRDWQRGDFDCDQRVDFPDFLILSEHFGMSAAASGANASQTASVPEPSSFLLSGLMLLGLAATRSKRRGETVVVRY